MTSLHRPFILAAFATSSLAYSTSIADQAADQAAERTLSAPSHWQAMRGALALAICASWPAPVLE